MRKLAQRTARPHITPRRRMALLSIAMILAMLWSFVPQTLPGLQTPVASAHNLNASAVYVFFDPDTQAHLDNLIATNQRPVGQPLLRAGDELGLIIKAVPDAGTTPGVGGYTPSTSPTACR